MKKPSQGYTLKHTSAHIGHGAA